MSPSVYVLIITLKFVIIAIGRNKRIWQERKRKELAIAENKKQKEIDLISYSKHLETDEDIQLLTKNSPQEFKLNTYIVRDGLRISYESIISIGCPRNSNKIFLLKVDKSCVLFIEAIDLDNNIVEYITIVEKLDFWSWQLTENKYIDYDEKYKYNEQMLLFNEVLTFFVSDNIDYIFIKLRLTYPYQVDKNTLNIKINLGGATLKKEYVTELNRLFRNYDHLNGLIVTPDYNFFNTNTFQQADLYEFFDECLDDENFSYLRYTEDSCKMFSTPSKNLYGIVLFDKDGDRPRGTFCVFNIDGDISPKLIFKYKVDEYGMNHVFSENGKKIAYIYNWHFGEIELVLRSLNTDEFENETRLTVYFSKESPTAEKILLTDHDHIIIVFRERFEVYSADSEKRICYIKRDIGTTYELANNTLFYLHNHRLKLYKF